MISFVKYYNKKATYKYVFQVFFLFTTNMFFRFSSSLNFIFDPRHLYNKLCITVLPIVLIRKLKLFTNVKFLYSRNVTTSQLEFN